MIEHELNTLILGGRVMDAFEKYYADDVVMQENNQPPTVGKEANRQREYEFYGTVKELHTITLHSSAVGDDVTMSEWSFDATYSDGTRRTLQEITRRLWRDGQVVNERFYYSPP